MRNRAFPLLLAAILVAAACHAADIRVPDDAADLAAAIERANPGDTILLGKGDFAGDVTVSNAITIRGVSRSQTRIVGKDIVVMVDGDLTLDRLAVVGGASGVYLKAGRVLRATRCAFSDAKEDGIGFENSTETCIELRDCIVTRNGDGIDLESTQGIIINCSMYANRDDALDFDGDARVTCIGCRFNDNGDDGVEVRIARATEAIFGDCEFAGNGEDGLEIINSPADKPTNNVLVVGHNTFTNNKRWGLGFVTAEKPEEAREDDRTLAAVLWGPNEFANNGKGAVSPNHEKEMQRAQPTANEVTIRVEQDGKEPRDVTVPLRMTLPVATISLQPALAGGGIRDCEGVTLMGSRMFIADDDTPGIYEIDLRTKGIVRTLSTRPIPGTELSVRGTEGLSVIEKDGHPALLLSCDDDNLLLTLDAREDTFGQLLSQVPTEKVAKMWEGVEQVGDRVYAAHAGRTVRRLNAADLSPVEGMAATFTPEGFGGHIAGVSFDGERLLLTDAAYKGKQVHTQYSLIIAVDPETMEPLEAWHIPYLDDPRGIACAGGMAWVADGKSPYTDTELGINVASGIRTLVFALSEDVWANLSLEDLPGPHYGE